MMTNGRKSKRDRRSRVRVVQASSTPWGTIAAVVVVALFAGGVFGYAFWQDRVADSRAGALAAFTPSASNQDPSQQIPGVVEVDYQGGQHVAAPEQVAYTQSPPMGGTHDQYWAACTGVVYEQPVRSENLVHSMEHGAAWIAYDPNTVTGEALAELARKVEGQPYTAMSPYPGLDQPVSLQTWGHQLKVGDARDPRIDQFLTALRRNQYTHPEVGASCETLGQGAFDQDTPPPFQPAPPVSELGRPGVRAEVENAGPAQPDGGMTEQSGGGS